MSAMFHYTKALTKSAKPIIDKLKKSGYGYTQVMNIHLFIIINSKTLKAIDKDILLWIINQSIGWQRLYFYFDADTIGNITNHSKKWVMESLIGLEHKGIITRVMDKVKHYNKSCGVIEFHPDYRFWIDLDYNKELMDKALHPRPQIVFDTENERIAKEEERERETVERIAKENDDLNAVIAVMNDWK